MLYELSRYFDYTGMNNPINKVYLTGNSSEEYHITLFIFVISHILKLFFLRGSGKQHRHFIYFDNTSISGPPKRVQDQMDGNAFTVGVHTILKQFHTDINKSFIKCLVQYCSDITRSTFKYGGVFWN